MSLTNKILLIILLSALWNIVVPGYVAYKNGVFYGKTFRNRVPDSILLTNLSEPKGVFVEVPDSLYKNGVKQIFKSLPIKHRVVIFSGFADNKLTFIWFSTYALLAIFILVVYRSRLRRVLNWQVLLSTIVCILLFHAPNWFRNSDLGKTGRMVYSFVHYDIDVSSFLLQELRAVFLCLLIAITWCLGEMSIQRVLGILRRMHKSNTFSSFLQFTARVRKVFFQWQRDSIIIVCTFLPWTWFYWTNITAYNDNRYFVAALLFHSFWIITWVIFSIPVMVLGYEWWRLKSKLMLTIYNRPQNDFDRKNTLIEEVSPFPKGQILISGIASFISLIAPLVQLFIK